MTKQTDREKVGGFFFLQKKEGKETREIVSLQLIFFHFRYFHMHQNSLNKKKR